MADDDMTNPDEVLAKNQEIWAEKYASLAQNLGPILDRVRNPTEALRSHFHRSHAARCTWGGEILDRLKGATVLEIGGGTGENAAMMLALGADRVVTTEITEEAGDMMRAVADELGFADRMEVRIGDFFTMDLGAAHSYDLVVANAVLHHITTADEDRFIARTAELLAPGGMTRIMDPAVNSKVLDWIRWAVPVPGRPSRLFQPAKFAAWKETDEHPLRDNSTRHIIELLKRHYRRVDVVVTGSAARYHRFVDSDRWHDVAWAKLNRIDEKIPLAVQMKFGDNHGLSAYDPL